MGLDLDQDLVYPYKVAVSGIISDAFATDKPNVDFQNPDMSRSHFSSVDRHGGRGMLTK